MSEDHPRWAPGQPARTATPTLDALAADPALVAALPPEGIPALVAQLAALQGALAARLLTALQNGRVPEAAAEDRPLTVPEVAAYLQCGKAYVYDLIRRGEMACLHFGKYVRVPLAALREWEARHHEKGLDKGQYIMYSSPVKGQRREWRRIPTHTQEARPDASGTR